MLDALREHLHPTGAKKGCDAVGWGHNDFKMELAKRTLCRTLAQAVQAG